MASLATSPIAPILGQRIPLRGPARLLFRSYAKAPDRQLGTARRLTTRAGDDFDVDLASFLEWQLWAFGSYEAHFAELFRILVRTGDRCIDVGANVGVHTIRLAKLVGDLGGVIAIEPDAALARRIRNNVVLNQLSNVRVIQAAADRHSGNATLYRPDTQDSNRARASLLAHSYLTGAAAEVTTITIDDVRAGPVALIKIDVEGLESAVVAGAAQTIAAYSPTIVFEYAPELLDSDSESPFGWLAEREYKLFRIRHNRHAITGRGGPVLERLDELPAIGGDIMAIPGSLASRVSCLVHRK